MTIATDGLAGRQKLLLMRRDLDDAAGAGGDCEAEAVQLDDGGHQAETEAQPGVAAALLGAVEAPTDELALICRDARAGIAHAHDSLVTNAPHRQFHTAALRRELHRIVDKIRDRLEQEIAVAADGRI